MRARSKQRLNHTRVRGAERERESDFAMVPTESFTVTGKDIRQRYICGLLYMAHTPLSVSLMSESEALVSG